ncbi:MAG: hypothetical protein E7672_08190 [Ruminococcaceae bacterium]|nr:hypothetical protein [Oscillospiraceae bacterium]
MKKEELCEIIGEINDKYITEAMGSHNVKKRSWKKIIPVAACFIFGVICISAIGNIYPFILNDTYESDLSQKNKDYVQILQGDTEQPANQSQEYIINDNEQPNDISDNQVTDSELQKRINQLSSFDSLGWIVYDGNIYIQNWNIDERDLYERIDEIKLSESLGYATDFIGFYKNSLEKDVYVPDGIVYMVADNPNILCIKLDNDGIVWLGKES